MRNLTIGAVRNGLARRLSATRSDRRPECGMAAARHPGMDRNPPAGVGIFGMRHERVVELIRLGWCYMRDEEGDPFAGFTETVQLLIWH